MNRQTWDIPDPEESERERPQVPPEQVSESEKEMGALEQENLSDIPPDILKRCQDEAASRIRERYEQAPSAALAFHNSQHAGKMAGHAQQIGVIIRDTTGGQMLTGRDLHLIAIICHWHDLVQSSTLDTIQDTFTDSQGVEHTFSRIKRTRDIGGNERRSAEDLIEFMDTIDPEHRIFTERDKEAARVAIDATIPAYEHGTVTQPHLVKPPHPYACISLAVAMADLSSAGMDEPEEYIREGQSIFREENPDLFEYRRRLQELPPGEQEAYREYVHQRILNFERGQLDFIQGRRAYFEQDIAPLPQATKTALRHLFSHYDSSYKAYEQRISTDATKPTEQLLVDFGF